MACRFVLLQLIIFLQFCEIQGQCHYFNDGTTRCDDHCIIRNTEPCICGLKGKWTGSPKTFCQKRSIAERASYFNPRYRKYIDATDLIDGDTTSFLHITGKNPVLFINFQNGLWRIKRFQVILDIWNWDSFRFSILNGDESYTTCYEEKNIVVPRTKYTWDIVCDTQLQGKTLTIKNTRSSDNANLKVYEVIIKSCATGTYGKDCKYVCPLNCPSDCYLESGQCSTCVVGKYGVNCDRNCSIGCYQDICKKDGQCSIGCKKGYAESKCSPCQDGTYGVNCNAKCSEGCSATSCDNVQGTCSSCRSGYSGSYCSKCSQGNFGSYCNDICDYCWGSNCDNFGECNQCTAGQYGSFCNKTCPLQCGGDGSCNITSGDCLHGCKPGYTGTRCSQCPGGTYDDGCRRNCSVGCSSTCHHVSGYCSSCLSGFFGDMCSPCSQGRFGFNCNDECDYCMDTNCDNNGSCHDCNAKWYGQYCNKSCPPNCGNNGACNQTSGECLNCKEGFYGQDCSNSCNVNCSPPKTCSRTGVCAKGCVNGWVGDKCDQQCTFDNCVECNVNSNGTASCSKCKDGLFLSGSTCLTCPVNCTLCESSSRCSKCVIGKTGRTCSKECNNNCINKTCNIDGKCDSGCLPGHYDTTCDKRCSDKCLGGYQECSKDGYCLKGCTNRTHGRDCNRSCIPHCLSCYSYYNCSKCKDGYYGRYCNYQCPTNCLSCENNTFCSKCSHGYHGTSCQSRCPNNCVSCSNETFCILCETGWSGTICQCNANCSDSCGEKGQCKNGCKDGLYGIRCERPCPYQDCVTCNQTSGNCSICISGKYGQHCDKTCNTNCLGKACTICGECLQGCADGFTGDTCALRKMEDVSFPLIPVVLGVLAVIIVLIILAVIMMSRRKLNNAKKTRKESREPEVAMSALGPESRMVYENMDISVSDNTQGGVIKQNKEEKSIYASRGSYALLIELDSETTDIQGDEGTDDVVQQTEYYNVQVNKIAVSALSDVIQKKNDNDEFQTEFESLPQGLTETYTKALEKKNKKRNRYKKIYPYDFNRVKLIGDSTDGGDYINASYVHGFSKENAFIAAQGPFTDDTLVDFWRMIWQKKVTKIVMLTNLVEGQVTKCWKYWPDDKERYGLCDVSLTKTTTYANCVVRTLNVKRKSESKQMQVNHFHFTAWPDKDVPKSASTILDFRNKVVRNESSKDGPTLVHCSAGIGRTGTYIALDYLVREGEQEGSVDILNCLTTLRRQRTQFVQTVEQYEFLHEALLEGLTMKNSSVDAKDFSAMYDKIKRKNPKSGKTFLREQFDDINTMIPNEKEGNFATAKLPENRKKNRYSNILAADNCRYFVTSSNGGDYINAIAIPSHNKTAAFALTQMPLPDTIEDFWNLVLSQSMTTIVMMNVVKKEKDPDIYWPLSGLSTFGKIKVQQLEEDVTNEAYRILKLSVTRVRSNECLVVKQFQCLFWPDEDGVPRGTRQMLQLMEDVDSWQRSNDNPTIVVHCLDGARKSGLFCAVSAILERVRAEQTVNVVRTISQMRSKRQQIVSSQEQLEYCYDVVNEYLEMSNTYTNV